jgi:hypothetical protein
MYCVVTYVTELRYLCYTSMPAVGDGERRDDRASEVFSLGAGSEAIVGTTIRCHACTSIRRYDKACTRKSDILEFGRERCGMAALVIRYEEFEARRWARADGVKGSTG